MVRPYRAVVFSGGGVHGFSMLGAAHGAVEMGLDLEAVEVLVGTSAGAVVAAAVALQVSLQDVLAFVAGSPLLSYLDLNFDGLVTGFGLDDGRGLERLIRGALGCDVTFEQLYVQTGKKLVVVATSVGSGRAVYFDRQQHGDMSINLAIKMSCSVPFMYDCVRQDDDMFVDGGVTDHFATSCAAVRGLLTLGVGLRYISAGAEPRIHSWSQYVGALFGILTSAGREDDESTDTDLLMVPVTVASLDLQLHVTEVEALIDAGRSAAMAFFST